MGPAHGGTKHGSTAERPLVSIVVPVWNGERHLRESLDSILGQTYANLEVIAVDDASTDSTSAILASYGDRVRVVRQPVTRGIYGNANDGIALARGEFVGVFHADDVYLSEMIEREVYWLLAHPDAGAVFTSAAFIDTSGREVGRKNIPPEVRGGRALDYPTVLNALLSYKNAFLGCPTALVRAEVYRRVGVYRDSEFKNTSDLEMWLRIARNHPLGVLQEELIRYRRGQGSSSERYHRLRTDQERFFTIMDIELGANGGRAVATPEGLAAFEAHRAQDTLARAVSHYILGERHEAESVLRRARLRTLAASPRIRRGRMLALALGLNVLVRLPRIPAVAQMFERRWHRRPAVPAR
ncbi:MAG: glycosyltransferase [Gaiellaceae bacterium MAG52_C11]|nr:glycosyltransferase [Candidatus Gaiellasilicea maunaloa]